MANECTVRRWFENFRSCDFDHANLLRGRPERKAVVEVNISQTTWQLASRLDMNILTTMDRLKQIGKVKNLDRGLRLN